MWDASVCAFAASTTSDGARRIIDSRVNGNVRIGSTTNLTEPHTCFIYSNSTSAMLLQVKNNIRERGATLRYCTFAAKSRPIVSREHGGRLATGKSTTGPARHGSVP